MAQRRLSDAEQRLIDGAYAAIVRLRNAIRELPEAVTLDHLTGMINWGTTDGKPYRESELTDEDAKQRPWVMIKHDNKTATWHGPKTLIAVRNEKYDLRYVTDEVTVWQIARRATPEEIARMQK